MFIKKLTISDNIGVIRELSFHKGINLIVDETTGSNGQETGNSVGKTTVLMLIDFCLGAKGKQIYTDPETKKDEYRVVKDFLIDRKVLIGLTLTDDLDDKNAKEVLLERNFLPRRDQIRRINGEEKTEEEYERGLTDLLFPGHFGRKPTFRQIISHNIRYHETSVNNTLKTLDRFSRDEEYETLYLFLLGCSFDEGDLKQELLTKLRLEQLFKSRLESEQTKSAYVTSLAILGEEIDALNRRKSNFNLNADLEEDLNSLNKARYQINKKSAEIARLNLRRELIAEAENDLRENVSDVDVRQLREIYEQAKVFVGHLHKTFEELQIFHNKMLREKARFITQDLPQIDSQIENETANLRLTLALEEALAIKISRSDSFDELESLIADLNERYRQKGEFENIIAQIEASEKKITDYEKQLRSIEDLLFSDEFEQKLSIQIAKLNKFFSAISQRLYGEKYALKFDPSVSARTKQRLYKFSAFNVNFSSGKKQGEISCFDIAYTLFADEENIPCFHFLLNDRKELMHDNQLVQIADLVNQSEIQFIASILKDKLPAALNKEEYFVVRLSPSDKLFRIESGKREK